MPIKFPGPSDRVTIIGRTGSGKTVAGVWHLSGKDFDIQPWVALNTKGDPLLNEIALIPGVKSLSLEEALKLPIFEPGMYIISTRPDQAEAINALLGKIWLQGNVGVYIDELYMIDETDNLNAILTQGRSRNVPFIGLSQRPAWVTKFVFSETDFVQLFNLQIQDDRKKIAQLVPVDKDYSLRKHFSYWYNVGDNILTPLGPVPPPDTLVERIRAKFPPNKPPEPAEPVVLQEVFGPTQGRNYL